MYPDFSWHAVTIRRDRQARPAEERTTIGRPYQEDSLARVGFFLAICGVISHILMDLGMLAGYCNEFGCMRKGCTAWRPNQCLPAYSDTYNLCAREGYPESHETDFRVSLMLFSIINIRAFAEPMFLHAAHEMLLQRSGAQRTGSRWRLFTTCAVLLALSTAGQAFAWNGGSTKVLHQIFATGTVAVWIAIFGLLILVMPQNARSWLTALKILWSVTVGGSLWLVVSWSSASTAWPWFVWEWALVFLQGTSIAAIGLTVRKFSGEGEEKQPIIDSVPWFR